MPDTAPQVSGSTSYFLTDEAQIFVHVVQGRGYGTVASVGRVTEDISSFYVERS